MEPWQLGGVLAVLLAWTVMVKAPVFQKAYYEHQGQLHNDAWLFNQCQNHEFASRMRQYDLKCEHINLLFQQTPWLVALHACFPRFDASLLALPCLLLLPSLLLPLYRAQRDRLEQQRVLHACSPALPATPRRRPAYYA